MNTNQQMASYYQILADGDALQWFKGKDWETITSKEAWLNRDTEYRLKPEPEVLYVNKLLSGDRSYYSSDHNAAANAAGNAQTYEYIAKRFTADE